MTAENDDVDPSDWLAAQFGDEPEPPKPTPASPVAAEPAISEAAADAGSPVVAPALPAVAVPTPAQAPPFARPPLVSPPVAPVASPEGGGFMWGLTPGAEARALPAEPPSTLPAAPVQPTTTGIPVEPPAPDGSVSLGPPAPDGSVFLEPPASDGSVSLEPPAEPGIPPHETTTAAFSVVYEPGNAQPTTSFDHPTEALDLGEVFAGQGLQAVAPDPSQWVAAPLDPALDGVTEVLEAELVGLAVPQGEGPGASAIDDLFGDEQFRHFEDEPLIPPLPPRTQGSTGGGDAAAPGPPKGPRPPIPRTQKILLAIAGALLAALVLVALFALGTRLRPPAPVASATPTPTAAVAPAVLPVGPVKPGDHHWDQLLGGECLKPFVSAWQDTYTVVDCAAPHPAQLVFRGKFADPASATYPGAEELQKRMTLLCTPATIINYAVAGTVQDIQVLASYAVDEKQWDKGDHDYFCFVNRSGGGDLSASVAIPQLAPAPAPGSTP